MRMKGAGSILAALYGPPIPRSQPRVDRTNKRVVVVANKTLMDDHQSQLLEALKDRVIVSTCDGLVDALRRPASSPSVAEGEREDGKDSFQRSIDALMGFE